MRLDRIVELDLTKLRKDSVLSMQHSLADLLLNQPCKIKIFDLNNNLAVHRELKVLFDEQVELGTGGLPNHLRFELH